MFVRPRFAFLLGAFCLLAGGATAAQEIGRPDIHVFTDRELPSELEINDVARDPRSGLLYLASRDKVVEFDGQRTRELPIPAVPSHPNFPSARRIAFSPDGRLFSVQGVAAWMLPATPHGPGPAIALTPPGTPRSYEHAIQDLKCDDQGAWVALPGRLGRWRDGQWKFWTVPGPAQQVPRLMPIGERVHARWPDAQLVRLVGDEPTPVLDGAAMQTTAAWSAAEYEPGGRWRFLTSENRRHHLWTSADGRMFTKEQTWPGLVSQASFLSGGGILTAVSGRGLVWRDANGGVMASADLTSGLPGNNLKSIVSAGAEGWWALANQALVRIAPVPAVSRFDRLNGLRGRVQALTRHAGRLYAATDEGVFMLRPAEDERPAVFVAVIGVEQGCAALLSHENELFAASRQGIHVLRAGGFVPLAGPRSPVHCFFADRAQPGRVYYGVSGGVGRLRREGAEWRDEGANDGFGQVGSLAGVAPGQLLVGGMRNLIRMATPLGPKPPLPAGNATDIISLTTPGRTDRELPPDLRMTMEQLRGPTGHTGVARWRDRAWAFGENGLFSVDAGGKALKAESFSSLPLSTHRLRLFVPTDRGHAWAALAPSAPQAAGGLGWRLIRLDDNDETGESLSIAWTAGAGEPYALLEESASPGESVLWIGGSDGLVRLLPRQLPPAPAAPRVVLRPFTPTPDAAGRFAESPEVLRIDFIAPWFHAGPALSFQTRLLGLSDGWSEPSPRAHAEFPHLPPGSYRFEVRARTPDGVFGPVTTLAFSVLPPWWRTGWAYGGLGLVTIGLVALLLHERGRALRRRNEALERLVAARTAELSTAKAAAESASHAKSSFLAHMSHELRTPLNAILGFSQILRRAPEMTEENRQRLLVVGRNGEHLLQMINEILDLSKIEAGRLVLTPGATDLPRLVHGLADTFAPRAADKGLAFHRELAGDLPVAVSVDETKLRQILINLLGNALKFTEAGAITFGVQRVAPGSPTLQFSIADTGIGIAAAELPALFEPFYQASSSVFRQQGTGLGLAISQRLVGMMGGIIHVESAPGSGSRFWFELTVSETTAPSALPITGRQITGYAGTRRRLLIVDDEPANRDVLRALLEPLGFVIEECADGRTCLDAFARQSADAILLDLRMPGELDGYATARALRALPGGGEPAILAVSASVFEEDRQTALDVGCDAFVPKPFSEERLFRALAEWLDLEWILRPEDFAAAAAPACLPVLPASIAEELHDLARRGDIGPLRTRLRTLSTDLPSCAPTLAHLDSLAAAFQLGRLRQELRATRSPASTPTP